MPMRRFVYFLWLAVALAVCPLGRADDDASARAILLAAVDAMGGAEHLAKLDQWFVEGKGRENLTGELQGLSPGAPTWRAHEERIAVSRATGSVAWERRSPRNDFSLRWRRFIYKPDAFGVVDWTSGEGGFRGRAIPENERLALMHRIPHLLLLDAATHAKQLRLLGERRRNGLAYDTIEVVMADARLTLFFARKPVVLARVEYSLYLPGRGDTLIGWQWHGWKRNQSLGFAPSGHAIDVGGTPFQEVEYSRYGASDPDAALLLSIPADLGPASRAHQEPPPPPAGPASGEIAPGVHVAAIRGFQVMFIEFKDFVVAFDAPAVAPGLEAIPAADQDANDSVSKDLAALIARTCPSKPIRYIVISHHHSDHLGGLHALASDNVTIYAAPSHVAAVQRSLGSPNAAASRAEKKEPHAIKAKVAAVPERKTITDGMRTLEIINVGANPHTSANLFLWLPKEKLVLQGDLFYYREGDRFPPPGRETMNRFFSKWLADHQMEPKAVYGVHGAGAAGTEALARAVRVTAPPKS